MDSRHQLKLLYLGFALPDEIAARHPEWNPAGQSFESALINSLAHLCAIQSISLTSVNYTLEEKRNESNDFTLINRGDGRIKNFNNLIELYEHHLTRIQKFDHLIVYNLSPVYNKFIKWLLLKADRPKLTLLLADSAQLGERLSWAKRLRYRLKPWVWMDDAMLPCFDGAICLSPYAAKIFTEKTRSPALWMPGAVPIEADPPDFNSPAGLTNSPCLGYFGSLSAYSGIRDFAQMFLSIDTPFRLEIRGGGREATEFVKLACSSNGRLKYHSFSGQPSDAIRMARERWDVLLNPRRALYGNRNNFASKVFQYILAGRPILTTNNSGEEEALGRNGFFLNSNFDKTDLSKILNLLIQRRSTWSSVASAAYFHAQENHNWRRKAEQIIEFLKTI
jgi:glycosyltransferase involved in cell wall biosynthesis